MIDIHKMEKFFLSIAYEGRTEQEKRQAGMSFWAGCIAMFYSIDDEMNKITTAEELDVLLTDIRKQVYAYADLLAEQANETQH